MSPADREAAIAAGTVMLTAQETAFRMGYTGRRGVERVRAMAAAKILPAFHPNPRVYRFHWPSVVEAIHRKAVRR